MHAGDLKITIPRRGQLTPVQRLNREGVEAVRKHDLKKAEELFYKAYLFDPDDPFTLNNLGYVAEVQGQIERAQNFYALASKDASEAIIDQASSKQMVGRSMKDAFGLEDGRMQINHANVEAVHLLGQGRAPEADLLLQDALKSDPKNIFTLNNMGVAKEMEGESQEALKYYDQAARGGAEATAVVTTDRSWKGRPISEMAVESAKKLRERMQTDNTKEAQVASLNLRGVSAVNRNDLRAAEENFRKAYALDPNNAFTLNNIGFVAEMTGDRETAQFFYDRAQQAGGANMKVGLATRPAAEGLKLATVAADSDSKVETKVTQDRNALRREHAPIVLRRRDNSLVEEPAAQSTPTQTPQ